MYETRVTTIWRHSNANSHVLPASQSAQVNPISKHCIVCLHIITYSSLHIGPAAADSTYMMLRLGIVPAIHWLAHYFDLTGCMLRVQSAPGQRTLHICNIEAGTVLRRVRHKYHRLVPIYWVEWIWKYMAAYRMSAMVCAVFLSYLALGAFARTEFSFLWTVSRRRRHAKGSATV